MSKRSEQLEKSFKALNLNEEIGRKIRALEREKVIFDIDRAIAKMIDERSAEGGHSSASQEMKDHFAETIRLSGIQPDSVDKIIGEDIKTLGSTQDDEDSL